MREETSEALSRLRKMRSSPKGHYDEISRYLSPSQPRVVRLDAAKALLQSPHPEAPARIAEIMLGDPDREFRTDVMEQLAKSSGKNAEKLAAIYPTFPREVRRKIAFLLLAHGTPASHPLMKRALEDESGEVRDMASGKSMKK